MSDKMTFPETWEEFEKSYGFDDSEEIYTNGSRLIPSFRVKQWLDHEENKRETKQQATVSSDLISRQEAIEAMCGVLMGLFDCPPSYAYKAVEEALEKLPSAESEPICINLNEPIKVKLTNWGKKIYYHQYDRTNQIAGREAIKPKFPKEDENGYTEFQLWCFMELYGEHMGMALPNVIEPLEIVYERCLTSAEPQKKGKWLVHGDIPTTCSCCHEDWDKYVNGDIWYSDELPNYCPNCGADMREGEEE